MVRIHNNRNLTVTCCKCGQKCLWTLRIKRGIQVVDDSVEVTFHILQKAKKTDKVEKIRNNGCIKTTCNKCMLQHLWTFQIERGETVADDSVEMRFHLTGLSLKSTARISKGEYS